FRALSTVTASAFLGFATLPVFGRYTEAVQIILTGIDNDIYSTVDACPNACEMWKAIERLKQGKSINVQDLETNLFWEFGKFTSLDGESLESYYLRMAEVCDSREAKSRAEACLISQTL
nr:hypothetical protein [Tanacetum cinerariifolium]